MVVPLPFATKLPELLFNFIMLRFAVLRHQHKFGHFFLLSAYLLEQLLDNVVLDYIHLVMLNLLFIELVKFQPVVTRLFA